MPFGFGSNGILNGFNSPSWFDAMNEYNKNKGNSLYEPFPSSGLGGSSFKPPSNTPAPNNGSQWGNSSQPKAPPKPITNPGDIPNMGGNGYPKDPLSPIQEPNQFWGQLPYYLEKSFLDIVNRSSPLYSQFQKNLQQSLAGSSSPNSFLALNLATGGGFQGSQYLANQKAQQQAGRNSDTAVNATDEFYTGMQDKAGGLLGLMLQDRQGLMSNELKEKLAELVANGQDSGLWGALGSLLGGAIGTDWSKIFGGGAGKAGGVG